jgi:hypothetical protein
MPTPVLVCVFCVFYGGGFVLPLVYYHFRRNTPWLQCLVPAMAGFIVNFLLLTTVADMGTVLLHGIPMLGTALMISLILLPYLISLRIVLFHRDQEIHGSRSNL